MVGYGVSDADQDALSECSNLYGDLCGILPEQNPAIAGGRRTVISATSTGTSRNVLSLLSKEPFAETLVQKRRSQLADASTAAR